LGELSIDGRIMLKSILQLYVVIVGTEFNLLRKGPSSGLF